METYSYYFIDKIINNTRRDFTKETRPGTQLLLLICEQPNLQFNT